MIATPSLAEHLPFISARGQAPAEEHTYRDDSDRQTTSFRELFQQSSTESSQPPKNDVKTKKDRPGSAWTDAPATAIPAPVHGEIPAVQRSAPSGPASPAYRAGEDLSTDLLIPASADGEELSVKLSKGTGSPTDLAFALRLKTIGSASITEKPGPLSLPASQGIAAKAGEIANSPQRILASAHAGDDSSADSQGGNPDSNQGNHAGVLAEKAGHTEKPDAIASVECASAHATAGESLVSPLVHGIASPAAAVGSAPLRAAAQAAPPLIATSSLGLEDAPASTRPAQEISLQLSSADDRTVDVRLVERAGEIHVSVRTPDVALAHDLRQDLGSLTGKLAQGGYSTEQFTPLSAGSTNLSDQRSTKENQDTSGGHRQGSQSGGSGQQQQPQDEPGTRPAWVEEMENSLAHRQTNRSTAWLLNR